MRCDNVTDRSECPSKSTRCSRWSSQQKKLMIKHFINDIKQKIAPRKKDCDDFKEKHRDMFADKTYVQIKIFVCNIYNSKNIVRK